MNNQSNVRPPKSRTAGHAIRGSVAAAIVAAVASGLGFAAWAQAPAPATALVSYTAEQADRGERLYDRNCAGCHRTNLAGEAETPPLIGAGFAGRYFTGTPVRFFAFISTAMPQGAPGSLELQEYADIMAYIMMRNEVPAGETELPADQEVLATLTFAE
jgi:mono/diheme cytochrome c family protein